MKPHYQPLTSILLASTLLCSLSSYSNAQQTTWKITSLEWEPYSRSSMNNSGNAIQHLRSMLDSQCRQRRTVETEKAQSRVRRGVTSCVRRNRQGAALGSPA